MYRWKTRSIVQPGLTTRVCISLMNAVMSGLDRSAHREHHHHCQCVTPNIRLLTGFLGCITPHCSMIEIILDLQMEHTVWLLYIQTISIPFSAFAIEDIWQRSLQWNRNHLHLYNYGTHAAIFFQVFVFDCMYQSLISCLISCTDTKIAKQSKLNTQGWEACSNFVSNKGWKAAQCAF